MKEFKINEQYLVRGDPESLYLLNSYCIPEAYAGTKVTALVSRTDEHLNVLCLTYSNQNYYFPTRCLTDCPKPVKSTFKVEDIHVLQAMERYGGGFVRALANAGFIADSDNLQRIKTAWPEYWKLYTARAREDIAKGDI
jgi:hypothetical protein